MHRLPFWVAIAAVISINSASAAGLMDVYQQALASDPQLKAADANRRAGLEAEVQAKAGLLPSISLTGSLGHTTSDPDALMDGTANQLAVNLSQPVYRAQNRINYAAGQLLAQRSELLYSQVQQQLLRRVVDAYLAVLQSETAFSTAKAEEAAVKRRLDQIQAQFDVGLIAVTDLEEARAVYDGARVSRIIAAGELDNSYESIERLTGQRFSQLEPLSAQFKVAPLEPSGITPWLDKAEQGNLELQLANLDLQLADKNAEAARSGRYPTLDLVASYTRDDGNYSLTDRVNRGFVGLSLNVPLYLGGGIDSRQREMLNQQVAALARREDVRRAVVQQTRSLRRDLATDLQTVAARKQAVISSQTALDATEAGYSVGTRNIVDVLQAERARYGAERDLQVARYTYLRNLFRFKETLGTLSPEDLQALDRWLVGTP